MAPPSALRSRDEALHVGPTNVQTSALKIYVLPLEAEQLAPPKPRVEQCGERGGEARLMLLSHAQQSRDLLGAPAIDSADLGANAAIDAAHQLADARGRIECHEPIALEQA